MLILVDFTLYEKSGRVHGIASGYRPVWRRETTHTSSLHCGALWLPTGYDLPLGYTCRAVLQPLCPEFWESVVQGEMVHAFEGEKCTGLAVVRSVFDGPGIRTPRDPGAKE